MSSVDFTKCECPLSLFLNAPGDFKRVQCHLLTLRKGNVALSNLRVKGPLLYRNSGYGIVCGSYLDMFHASYSLSGSPLSKYYPCVSIGTGSFLWPSVKFIPPLINTRYCK